MGFPYRQFFTVLETVGPAVLSVTPAAPLIPFVKQAVALSEAFHANQPSTGAEKLAFARQQYATSLDAINAQALATTGHAVVDAAAALAAFDAQASAVVAATRVKLQNPSAPVAPVTPAA